jgi:hypothetical protein
MPPRIGEIESGGMEIKMKPGKDSSPKWDP